MLLKYKNNVMDIVLEYLDYLKGNLKKMLFENLHLITVFLN